MTKSRALVLISALTALASCATVKELEVTAPLAPMPQPQLRPGYTEVTLYNGKEMTSTLVAEDATTRSWKRSDGCSATTPKTGFGPAYFWENCNGSTGSATSKLEGEIWPLAVGKSWSYTYSGSNARGATWSGTRSCTVKMTARIATPAGGRTPSRWPAATTTAPTRTTSRRRERRPCATSSTAGTAGVSPRS